MRYLRSRPWRSRGPWLTNRTGARRRGRRDDEASLGPDALQDDAESRLASPAAAGADVVVASELPRPAASAWTISRQMGLASDLRVDTLARSPGAAALGQSPEHIDQLAEVTAARALSQQSDESAADSRQPA